MENIIGFVSIGILLIIQISIFAYNSGQLKQTVSDLKDRVTHLENKFDTDIAARLVDMSTRLSVLESKVGTMIEKGK